MLCKRTRTMQIAKQVYNINTAENAIFFNGIPAYITKRFDVRDDNTGGERRTLAGKKRQW